MTKRTSITVVTTLAASTLVVAACGGEGTNETDETGSSIQASSGAGASGGAGGAGGAGTGTPAGAPTGVGGTTGVGAGGAGGTEVIPNPDAHYVVFDDTTNDVVYGIDLTAGAIAAAPLGADGALALTGDGQTLLARVGDQAILVDLTTSPPSSAPFGSWTLVGPSISPDDQHLYASAKQSGDSGFGSFVLDLTGNVIAELDQTMATQQRWAPDSSALAGYSAGYLRVNVIGHATVADIPIVGGDVEDVVWAPTSDRFVYVIDDDGPEGYRVMLATLSGTSVVTEQLVAAGGYYDDDFPPSWSPDGSRVVFEDDSPGVQAVRIVDVSGAQPSLSTIADSSTYRGALYASSGVLYAPSLFERRWYAPGFPLSAPAVTSPSTQSYLRQRFSDDAQWLCLHEGGPYAVLFDMSAFPSSAPFAASAVSPCRFAPSSDYLFASANDALIDLRSGSPIRHDLSPLDGPSWAVQTGSTAHVLHVDDNGDVHHQAFDGQSLGTTTKALDVAPGTDPSWDVYASSARF